MVHPFMACDKVEGLYYHVLYAQPSAGGGWKPTCYLLTANHGTRVPCLYTIDLHLKPTACILQLGFGRDLGFGLVTCCF